MYLFGVWILLRDWLARWSFRVTGGGAEPALHESIERERRGRNDSPPTRRAAAGVDRGGRPRPAQDAGATRPIGRTASGGDLVPTAGIDQPANGDGASRPRSDPGARLIGTPIPRQPDRPVHHRSARRHPDRWVAPESLTASEGTR